MRKMFVAGNWKMNLDLKRCRSLVDAIREGLDGLSAGGRPDIAVCPPAIYLLPLARAVDGSDIRLGAQDVHEAVSGAFTGEIAAEMVAETGAKYVIIGHSERRHTIGHLEDDHMINLKIRATRRAGLTPILCLGETLTERKAERTLEVLTYQLTAGMVGIDVGSSADLVIAYEPVWAIGTGQVATPDQAQDAHAHLRSELRKLVGAVAGEVRILYGGSVTPDNAAKIFGQADVDGGLIGGASLKAEPFVGIVSAALAAAG